MMSAASVFNSKVALPDDALTQRQKTLLGFDERYARIRNQLELLLKADELEKWSKQYHGRRLPLIDLLVEQYPLAIFHGDVGTGKTAMAETIANRLVADAKVDDSTLFKLSNRVRGTGRVGEMGTLIADAFAEIAKSIGKSRRAMLVIDEGDSLGAARSQDHSHHEDKVAVNTLIQSIDDIRNFGGRVVVFLCTNRLTVLDPAILRRASIVEEFRRPSDAERLQLLQMDLEGLGLTQQQLSALVAATAPRQDSPGWTYSDIRTRLYPAALAMAFPREALSFAHLQQAVTTLRPSPVLDDR